MFSVEDGAVRSSQFGGPHCALTPRTSPPKFPGAKVSHVPSPSPAPAMNAEAYLRKQGWQGSGHSLDKTGRGIKKPLLIAHKNDQLGLGKKKAAHTTDDQWWLRAFDQSLQSIGTGKDVRT